MSKYRKIEYFLKKIFKKVLICYNRDGGKNKMTKNKTIIIIVSAIALALVGGAGLFLKLNQTDTMKIKKEYENLNSETGITMNINPGAKFEYATVEEQIERLKSGTGIIYFGFPKCPWCRNILPVLSDVAKENKQTIYYFNPSEIRDKTNESYRSLISILDPYLDTDDKGEKTLYVPDVYFVKDGKIVGHQLGSVKSQTNPTTPLTADQKQELKNIYQNLINKIK